ncbi:Alanyl-tRNA synthetase [Mycoplasma haemocanis str. Illinois]|uniref:Alanine--tRNA ligase n=1 Tax=Mycoplasma haemocanis (strain Illinois) TaxID=1111676 RepID=H6N5I9_MYCHN|nr:alanine--tRNA ligase [Mycoplasma haemocanis]AEW44949.1 Alanyl-tRNA synthetase [Mycoplasma haemocanis str. Illinois]
MVSSISASELKKKWIDFFVSKGHLDVSNRSLIPPSTDKSLLFINSGVAAIKSYFSGDTPPPSRRLVSCQKVIRTGDIESIGESVRHHTYFEMLGNFSLGDYFKAEAIEWSWEFLIKHLGIDPDKLYVTIYREDVEAMYEWKKWISEDRIIFGDKDTNFWDMGVGPCGPCTEIYFDRGPSYDPDNIGLDLLKNNIENNRYLEIWNIVFSEFLNIDGQIVPAPQKNIDTGAGLERILSVLEGKDSNFESSLFSPIVNFIDFHFSKKDKKVFWSAADYFRASCILLDSGISFGGKGREYVLRKIFRKTIWLFKSLEDKELDSTFFSGVVNVVGESLVGFYPSILQNKESLSLMLYEEYLLSVKAYEKSHALLIQLIKKYDFEIPAKEIFDLVTSHGLELWLIQLSLSRLNRTFNEEQYESLMEEHKNISFNKNISSAFIKKHPKLLALDLKSSIDYFSSEKNSKIVAIFNEDFELLQKLDGIGYLLLDETVVFPMSGGQDSDTGYVNGKIIKESLKAPNGQVLHKVAGTFSLGEEVMVSHDKDKRGGLEKHHTSEHLLFELLKRVIDKSAERVSGQKYSDYFNLEVNFSPNIDKKSFNLAYLNKELCALIDSNLPVNYEILTLEEAKFLNIPIYFEEVYRKSEDNLRLVNIGGYSRELCIGTHVKSTKEIEDALIVGFKKKQSSIYKFKVIVGSKRVSDFLSDKPSREAFLSLNEENEILKNKEIKKQKISSEKMELRNRIKEVINSGPLVILKENDLHPQIVQSVFKEIRNELKGCTLFLFNEFQGEVKYYVVSDVIDVLKLLEILKSKYSWKGGGNAGFGTGVASDLKEGFEEELFLIHRGL